MRDPIGSIESQHWETFSPLHRWTMPLACAALAAFSSSLFIYEHFTAAIVLGMAILSLSAAANEGFILLMIFLTPVGWFAGKTATLISAAPARSNIDVMLLIRCAVIGGYFLGRIARGKVKWRKLLQPSISKASIVLALAFLLSSILGEADLRTISLVRVGLRAVVYLGSFFLVLTWCDSRQRTEKVAFALLISTLVTAAFAIVQRCVGEYTPLWHALYPPGSNTFPWDSRSTSFFDYPNDLASYLNLILPLILAFYAIGPDQWRRLAKWTFVAGAIAMLCTQSRGGLMAFGCTLLMGCWVFVPRWRDRALLLGGAGVLGGLLFIAKPDSGAAHLGFDELSSGAIRLYLWDVAVHLFINSPFHGIGWGNFQVVSGDYIDSSLLGGDSQLGVHNTYLALLAETGIVGLLCFILLAVSTIRSGLRLLKTSDPLSRSLGFGIVGAMVSLLLQGMVEFQIAVTQIGVILWTLLAVVVVHCRLTQTRLGEYAPSA